MTGFVVRVTFMHNTLLLIQLNFCDVLLQAAIIMSNLNQSYFIVKSFSSNGKR